MRPYWESNRRLRQAKQGSWFDELKLAVLRGGRELEPSESEVYFHNAHVKASNRISLKYQFHEGLVQIANGITSMCKEFSFKRIFRVANSLYSQWREREAPADDWMGVLVNT